MEAISDEGAQEALVGFWRRLIAFVIDWLLLGLAGNMLGQIVFDPPAAIGEWGRVVGFAIAVAYFGLFDSGWFGAGTPGKRVAGLSVVDAAGREISLPRSLIRSVLLTAPFLFNDMTLAVGSASLTQLLFGGAVGGLLFASLYMAAFNRVSRQGLHDLAVGTYVVHAHPCPASLRTLTVWRPHILIAVFLFVVSVTTSMMGHPIRIKLFSPGVAAEATLPPRAGKPVIRAVWMAYSPSRSVPLTCDRLTVLLAGTGVDDEALARRIASDMASRVHCHVRGHLGVQMFYAFDLGFAAGKKYRDFVLDEALFSRSP